jgi:hypothetical protein
MEFRAFLAAITFCFTAVFLPVFILEATGGISMTTGVITSFIIIIYIGLHLSYLVFDGGKKILDITFWIFSYVWLGAASLAQHASSQYPWWGYYNDSEILFSFFIILIGFLSYDLATYFVTRSYEYTPKINSNAPGFSYIKTILLGIVASVISMYLIYQIGLGNFFVSRTEMRAIFESKMESILQQNFAKAPIFACFLICIQLIKNISFNQGKRTLIILLMLLLLVLNVIVSNPISSARFWTGTVVLSTFFILANWKSYTNFLLINFFVLSFIILFPYTDAFRRTTDATINVELQEDAIISPLTQKGDYDAYQMVMNTIKYTRSSDITYGRQLAGSILFWVPRSFWQNKPVNSGQYVAEGLRYSYTNLSCPLWAEAYINFGVMGVIAIFFIYGIVKERLQIIYDSLRTRTDALKSNNYLTVIIPFFAAYQIFALRGSLINAFAYSSVFLLFFFLHLKLKRSKKT